MQKEATFLFVGLDYNSEEYRAYNPTIDPPSAGGKGVPRRRGWLLISPGEPVHQGVPD